MTCLSDDDIVEVIAVQDSDDDDDDDNDGFIHKRPLAHSLVVRNNKSRRRRRAPVAMASLIAPCNQTIDLDEDDVEEDFGERHFSELRRDAGSVTRHSSVRPPLTPVSMPARAQLRPAKFVASPPFIASKRRLAKEKIVLTPVVVVVDADECANNGANNAADSFDDKDEDEIVCGSLPSASLHSESIEDFPEELVLARWRRDSGQRAPEPSKDITKPTHWFAVPKTSAAAAEARIESDDASSHDNDDNAGVLAQLAAAKQGGGSDHSSSCARRKRQSHAARVAAAVPCAEQARKLCWNANAYAIVGQAQHRQQNGACGAMLLDQVGAARCSARFRQLVSISRARVLSAAENARNELHVLLETALFCAQLTVPLQCIPDPSQTFVNAAKSETSVALLKVCCTNVLLKNNKIVYKLLWREGKSLAQQFC